MVMSDAEYERIKKLVLEKKKIIWNCQNNVLYCI